MSLLRGDCRQPPALPPDSLPQAASSGLEASRAEVDPEVLELIAELPRDVGWFLLVGGLLTELGVVGVPPFWIIGIMILWPQTGMRVAACLKRRSPGLFKGCLRMVGRYARDLERRHPRR